MTLLDAAAIVAPTVDTDDERACCVFGETVVELWAGLPHAEGPLLAAWRLFDGEPPWSPVQAAVASGAAESASFPPAAPVAPVGRWLYCQGWRGKPLAPGVTGHTFLLRRASDTRCVQIDSAIPRGVSFRPRAWADVLAEFTGGLAVAVLRKPA